MIIEINKDIEKYQESVAMGLTAKPRKSIFTKPSKYDMIEI